MENQKQYDPQDAQQVANLARHQSQCSICLHSQRESIEEDWVNWGNTTVISERYKVSRDAVYRHACYLDLYQRRQKNIKGALERIIERLDLATLTGSTVLGAIRGYAKLVASEEALQATQAAKTGMQEEKEPEMLSDAAATLKECPEVEKQGQLSENTTVQ